VRRCMVDDIFARGRDTQAVMGWDGTRNLVLEDSWLSAAGEAVMLGGAAARDEDHGPAFVAVHGCTLTKNPAWITNGMQVKNALELKNARHVSVTDCVLEYAGTSEGQGGYLIVLTPRNQDGDTPWATVADVTIERCLARYGGGCLNVLGKDDVHPSGPLDGVTVRNVLFDQIDPAGITGGSGRCFQFGNGPWNVALEALTVRGAGLSALGYFYGAPPAGLRVSNIVAPRTTYGWKVDGGGMGIDAVRAYAPDAAFTLLPADQGAAGYPVPA
jgi:hypothetical protein